MAAMPAITVKKLDELTFEVTVQNVTLTTHVVSVPSAYAQKLTSGRISAAELVQRSFEFLLEREPNTSILRRFDLPVIANYFPEYEQAINKML